MPLWSYAKWSVIEVRHEIMQNILLFLPYGSLLKANGFKRPILIAALTSLAVELIQYITALGLCELDDLINNTLGAALGVLVFTLGMKAAARLRKEKKSG